MQALFEIVLANAVCASALALGALGAGRFPRLRTLRNGLWLLVLVKLITPPLFHVPLHVLPADEKTSMIAAATPAVAEPPTSPAPSEDLPVIGQMLLLSNSPDGELVLGIEIDPVVEETPVVETRPPPASPAAASTSGARLDWELARYCGLGAWAIGAVVWFAYASWKMIRFGVLLREARPVAPDLADRAALLARRIGLARCPDLALIPGPVPPMIWMAFGSPKIYLPAALLEKLSAAECDTVLAHELAHVKRRDHWVRWLEFVVQGVYWWFPLVPFARRQLHSCEEESCDAIVVDLLPAPLYASAIVRTLDFLAGDMKTLPATASGLGRVATLKCRLTRILTGRLTSRIGVAGRLALAALAAMLLPLAPILARSQAIGDPVVDAQAGESVAADGEFIEEASVAENSYLPAGLPVPRVLAYSPDGSQLAVGMEDGRIEIRDPATGAVRHMLSGHNGPVNCLVYSPDGSALATGGSDRTVKVWEPQKGQLRATLTGHGHWVYALAFASDNRTLASGGYDRTILIWNVATGSRVATLGGHSGAVRALSFSPDSRILASGSSDCTVRLWDATNRKLRTTLKRHRETVRALAFSADGRILASGSDDGTARLWNLPSGTLRCTLRDHDGEVTALAFAPVGRLLLAGGSDRVLRAWDAGNGRFIAPLPIHPDGLIGMAFDVRRSMLTSLGNDRQLRHVPLARVEVRVGAEQTKRTVVVLRKQERRAAPANPRITIVEFQRGQ